MGGLGLRVIFTILVVSDVADHYYSNLGSAMACPYFCPTAPMGLKSWKGKFRPPLGEVYAGECRACGGERFQPSGVLLLEGCNLGYAGPLCERFPSGQGADAVRFSLDADDGAVVLIRYVIEQEHLPCRHGSIRYDRSGCSWRGLDTGSVFHQQAQAYLGSYLRWKESHSETDSDRPRRL